MSRRWAHLSYTSKSPVFVALLGISDGNMTGILTGDKGLTPTNRLFDPPKFLRIKQLICGPTLVCNPRLFRAVKLIFI